MHAVNGQNFAFYSFELKLCANVNDGVSNVNAISKLVSVCVSLCV